MNNYLIEMVQDALRKSGCEQEISSVLMEELWFHSFCQLLVNNVLTDLEVMEDV